jgi:sec-independent protein translocase protein TatB
MVREAELAEMEKKWAEENARIMRDYPPEKALPAPVYDPNPEGTAPAAVEPEDAPPATVEPPALKPEAADAVIEEAPAKPVRKPRAPRKKAAS